MSNFTGKGSRHRPHDAKKYADNYDKIFGKKKDGNNNPLHEEQRV